jgi:hypothetical protein
MGFLGGLFGRSSDRKSVATDRCMECGMTKGSHTEWCPGAAKAAAAPEATRETGASQTMPEQAGEAPPPS